VVSQLPVMNEWMNILHHHNVNSTCIFIICRQSLFIPRIRPLIAHVPNEYLENLTTYTDDLWVIMLIPTVSSKHTFISNICSSNRLTLHFPSLISEDHPQSCSLDHPSRKRFTLCLPDTAAADGRSTPYVTRQLPTDAQRGWSDNMTSASGMQWHNYSSSKYVEWNIEKFYLRMTVKSSYRTNYCHFNSCPIYDWNQ